VRRVNRKWIEKPTSILIKGKELVNTIDCLDSFLRINLYFISNVPGLFCYQCAWLIHHNLNGNSLNSNLISKGVEINAWF
jgi:hypothetical protein